MDVDKINDLLDMIDYEHRVQRHLFTVIDDSIEKQRLYAEELQQYIQKKDAN